jgi:rare lipoprotein A
MKLKLVPLILVILFFLSYKNGFSLERYSKIGMASWYGKKFHGKKTASGKLFNMHAPTAAHRFLPFGTLVKVINLQNHKEVIVKIVDRGPFNPRRVIDLSHAAAKSIGLMKRGIAKVKVQVISLP